MTCRLKSASFGPWNYILLVQVKSMFYFSPREQKSGGTRNMVRSPDANANGKRKEDSDTSSQESKRNRVTNVATISGMLLGEKRYLCTACNQPMWNVLELTCHSCQDYIYKDPKAPPPPPFFVL